MPAAWVRVANRAPRERSDRIRAPVQDEACRRRLERDRLARNPRPGIPNRKWFREIRGTESAVRDARRLPRSPRPSRESAPRSGADVRASARRPPAAVRAAVCPPAAGRAGAVAARSACESRPAPNTIAMKRRTPSGKSDSRPASRSSTGAPVGRWTPDEACRQGRRVVRDDDVALAHEVRELGSRRDGSPRHPHRRPAASHLRARWIGTPRRNHRTTSGMAAASSGVAPRARRQSPRRAPGPLLPGASGSSGPHRARRARAAACPCHPGRRTGRGSLRR